MAKAYIELEEVMKMEEAVHNLRDRLLIRVLFWLGCRVSEALGIQVPRDIDFENGIITIKHLKARITRSCPFCRTRLSKTAVHCSGCGKKVIEVRQQAQNITRQRQVPVDMDTLEMLRYFIENDHTKGPLFKIGRTQAWRIITTAARDAGIEELINPATGKLHNVSPHKLRDAFATMAVKADDSMDSIRSLQEHLGHQSINTTMKYRKVDGTEQRQWYDKTTRVNGRQLNFLKK